MRASPISPEPPLTRTQRWASVLTIALALIGLGIGFLMKDQIISATVPFRDLAAGILARYPQGWLLDTEGDYVFRVRDPEAPRFLTTLQVQVIPIGEDAAARNILDDLTLKRAQTGDEAVVRHRRHGERSDH